MTHVEHIRWMDEHNPEGWTSEQWRAHKTMIERGGSYAREMDRLSEQRHEWAAEQVVKTIGGRRSGHGFRIKLRRDLNRDARLRFPNPDPIEALDLTAAGEGG